MKRNYKSKSIFFFQQTWKQEVWDYNERVKGEDASLPLADHDILIKRRKQELKHAQDVKELYERKLERVNDLFVELNAWKLQLEESERTLNKRERQLSIQGSKVHYKKKLRPIVNKASERLRTLPYTIQPNPPFESQKKVPPAYYQRKSTSPSTPDVLSTSPESPANLIAAVANRGQNNLTVFSNVAPKQRKTPQTVVRENPMFSERLTELYCTEEMTRETNICPTREINGNLMPPVLRRAKTFHHGVRALGDNETPAHFLHYFCFLCMRISHP